MLCFVSALRPSPPLPSSCTGANCTYTIEAMMGDRKALQAGTSHTLGTNFAKVRRGGGPHWGPWGLCGNVPASFLAASWGKDDQRGIWGNGRNGSETIIADFKNSFRPNIVSRPGQGGTGGLMPEWLRGLT